VTPTAATRPLKSSWETFGISDRRISLIRFPVMFRGRGGRSRAVLFLWGTLTFSLPDA
jgi:hypothetical protein